MTEENSPEERFAQLERRLVEQEALHQSRMINAELKSVAMRAGIIDVDGIKLFDVGAIKLNDAGEIDGVDRLMADFRRSRPWLFQAASSSSLSPTPPSTPPIGKRATAMTHAEWQQGRAELLRRR